MRRFSRRNISAAWDLGWKYLLGWLLFGDRPRRPGRNATIIRFPAEGDGEARRPEWKYAYPGLAPRVPKWK